MTNQQTIQNEEKVSIDYTLVMNGEQKETHENNTMVIAIAKSAKGIGVNAVGEFSVNLHLNMIKALISHAYSLFLEHKDMPMDQTAKLIEDVTASAYNAALVEQVSKRVGLEEIVLKNILHEITEGKKEEPCVAAQLAMQAIQELEEEKAQANESNQSIQEPHSEETSSVESSGVSEAGTETTGSEAEGTGNTATNNG